MANVPLPPNSSRLLHGLCVCVCVHMHVCVWVHIYMQFQSLQIAYFQSGLMSSSAVTVSEVDGAAQMQLADGVE